MEPINIFKALSDETRLRILSLLRRNELSVNEIVCILDMGQSRVSRHLKILTDAGLLSFRKEGLWVFYKMESTGLWGGICGPVFDSLGPASMLMEDSAKLNGFLQGRSEQKREYFNSIAHEWESIRKLMLGDLDLNSSIVGQLSGRGTANAENTVAADLGCGSGGLCVKLLSRAGRVIGVDRSPAMLEQARGLLAGHNGAIDLRLGELEHLPMRDSEADIVVISMVLHYLDEQQQAVDEAARVLRPGGTLLIAELDTHGNEEMRSIYGHRRLGFSKETVAGWMTRAGLVLKSQKSYKAGEGLTAVIYMAVKAP